MPENQAHGKLWETELGINVYKATEAELLSIPHTSIFDMPKEINRIDNIDLSIKVSGSNSIDMADVIRLYNAVSSGNPFHMTVILWKQSSPTEKTVTRIIEINLTNSVKLLFGTATLDDINELVSYVKSIPINNKTAEHANQYKQMAAALSNNHGGCILYAPKVDSKSQRRVQCRLPKFCEFVTNNQNLVIEDSITEHFRGSFINKTITSTPRIRNKKTKSDSQQH